MHEYRDKSLAQKPMRRRARLRAVALALGLAMMAAGTRAQDSADEQYHPLFTDDMIQRASPEQGQRMRVTEDRNRQAFEDRQTVLRTRREAEEQQARQQAAPTLARGPSKIYKWVDKNGRVHFGDARQSSDAQEVTVGGAARIKGTPLPPPNETRSD